MRSVRPCAHFLPNLEWRINDFLTFMVCISGIALWTGHAGGRSRRSSRRHGVSRGRPARRYSAPTPIFVNRNLQRYRISNMTMTEARLRSSTSRGGSDAHVQDGTDSAILHRVRSRTALWLPTRLSRRSKDGTDSWVPLGSAYVIASAHHVACIGTSLVPAGKIVSGQPFSPVALCYRLAH
jgi:hypothetical protein